MLHIFKRDLDAKKAATKEKIPNSERFGESFSFLKFTFVAAFFAFNIKLSVDGLRFQFIPKLFRYVIDDFIKRAGWLKAD